MRLRLLDFYPHWTREEKTRIAEGTPFVGMTIEQLVACLGEPKEKNKITVRRAKQEQWKTGFYHVALNAGVPIALAYMDYEKKKTGVGKIVYPTGDYEKDMAEIMQFYAQISPKFPEDFSVDSRYYSAE